MTSKLEHAKSLVLGGASYRVAAAASGYSHEIELYKELKDDPDIVAAKASGAIKPKRTPTTATKGPEHYARKPYVQAVLNGMTQVEAAAKFGVSQPLVGRHLKLAGGVAKVGRPLTTPPTSTHSPEAQTLATTLKLLAASSGKSPKALWDEVAAVL